MNTEPLDLLPLWLFFVIATIVALLSIEVGYRLGVWRHARASGEKEGPVGAMVGSILGLLALTLAFTFNLAASRFDARRQSILEEANAIGTTYLRARLLPEPQRSEISQLLREYVAVRLKSVQERTVAEGIAKSEEIQQDLWAKATVVAEKNPGSIMTGLFLQSLNEVIDLHAKRLFVGMQSRIPFSIWIALFALAMLGMASMGYQIGLSATQRSPAEFSLALAFAGVLFLIVDLDRGHTGFLQVSQQAMIDLQSGMHASQP